MGLSLEASELYRANARPRYFDSLEAYHPADGAVLWQVHMRKKNVVYYVFRYTYKAARGMVRAAKRLRLARPDVQEPANPLPFEVMGLYDDETKAQEACRLIGDEARRLGVKVGLDYGPLEVNKTFPVGIVRWGGLTRPSAWLFQRERAPVTLYRLVADPEWKALRAELDEYREGRHEDIRDQLRRLRCECREMRAELGEVGKRLSELERGRRSAGCAAGPH